MKNTVPVVSAGRQPRGAVQINGVRFPLFREWEAEANSNFRADTFRVTLPLYGLPKGNDAAWFGSQASFDVELFAGFPSDAENFAPTDLESVLQGRADDLQIDWRNGTLDLTGRDRTADLIDTKTSKKFANMKSSAIVSQIAGDHGLTAVVKATSTMAGKFYDKDHVRLQDDRTEWDLITWLAKEEGYVAFVKGKELHFEPAAEDGQDPYVIKYQAPDSGQVPSGNFVRLNTSRTLTVAKGVKVTVRSWNHKQKKTFEKTAAKTKSGAATAQQYVYTIPNLTPEQAQDRATKLLADISKHEMKLTMDGPADNLLQKTDVIQLQGTGTAFDQTYFPDIITRTMSPSEGYVWRVQAKNHSPESDANL